MTTYPDRQAQQFAATIKKMNRRLTVAETQLNNAKTTIANHVATIASLTTLVNTLYTRIGDPHQTGTAGLLQAQSVFLATINAMTTPGTYPLATDGGSGSYWITGERNYVNGTINMDNLLIQKLQRANLMTP